MTTWILLRGLARESRHWGVLPQQLRNRFRTATVLGLDLPGNGRLNDRQSPTSVRAMMEAMRMEARTLGFAPPYHLLAMSLGAMVAIAWATDNPQEVAGAVLINTSVGGMHPFYQRLKPDALLRLLWIAMPGLSHAHRERAILGLTSNGPAPAEPEFAERVRYREERPSALANVLRQLVAAVRFNVPRRPPFVPLLVLAGARDRLVDPACSRRLAQAWRVEYAEHPRAGHDLALDDPQWVVHRVCDWISDTTLAPDRGEPAKR